MNKIREKLTNKSAILGVVGRKRPIAGTYHFTNTFEIMFLS